MPRLLRMITMYPARSCRTLRTEFARNQLTPIHPSIVSYRIVCCIARSLRTHTSIVFVLTSFLTIVLVMTDHRLHHVLLALPAIATTHTIDSLGLTRHYLIYYARPCRIVPLPVLL